MFSIGHLLLLIATSGKVMAVDWSVIHDGGVIQINIGEPGGIWEVSGSSVRTSITIPGDVERIRNSAIFEGKLVLLGSDRYSDVVGVFDLDRGELIDQIRGYSMALSPSGRFIVFEHFYPPHGMHESQTNLTVLYDVTRSPEENRVGGVGVGGTRQYAVDQNAGIPLYPAGQAEERPYFVWIEDERERLLMHVAGYVWTSDERRLAFALLKDGESILVVLDLSGDYKSAKVTELALKEIGEGSGSSEMRAAVMSIELGNSRRAKLVGPDWVLFKELP